MYTGNVDLLTIFKYRSITNWGIAGAIMVGLPAYFVVGDDGAMTFMTVGFVSFLLIRAFLMLREDREAKEGF